eukprot:CAMPEP_0183829132 /NCGR_PEP_ID=MMETSP0807_2-20130328/3149_1 /TAXON_ID=88271 /ORGANISM="Picocystis salinarum, Strain CCMP1897" /LENGTH=910 /DNA_ID=CAMNT_0026074339 /DNA_START=62 /DNA_END=2794 /DNA_ORIENTATION=+
MKALDRVTSAAQAAGRYMAGQPGKADGGASEYLDQIANEIDPATRREALLCLRDACLDSIRAKESVGTVGIHTLISVLRDERDKKDLLAPVLETLVNCTQPIPNYEASVKGGNIADINADQLIRVPETIDLILGLLKQEDFYIKYNATLLLTILLRYNTELLQESVLSCPMGVVCILDLLAEQNAVRNEALNLLLLLSSGHTEIQKICAFEGAFVHLLEIIEEEGGLQGGSTVKQCLDLINNLIHENRSNQTFFRESTLLPKFVELLRGVRDAFFNKQRRRNALSALEIVATFATPCTSQAEPGRKGDELELTSNQNALGNLGILEVLANLSLAHTAPPIVALQATAIQTLSFLMVGNPTWQRQFLFMRIEPEPDRCIDGLQCLFELSLYCRDEVVVYGSNLLIHAVLCNVAMLGPEASHALISLVFPKQLQNEGEGLSLSLLQIFCSHWGSQSLQSVSNAALLLGYFVNALGRREEILAFVPYTAEGSEPGTVVHIAFAHLGQLGNTDEENVCALHILYFLFCLCAGDASSISSILSNGENPLLLFDLMYANLHSKLESIEGMLYRMSATLFGSILVESAKFSKEDAHTAWQPSALIDLLVSRIGIYRFFRGFAALVNDFRTNSPWLCLLLENSDKFQLTQPLISGLYRDDGSVAKLMEILRASKQLVLATLSTPQALMQTGSMETAANGRDKVDCSTSTEDVSQIEQELSMLRSRNESLAKELADMAGNPTGELSHTGVPHANYKQLLDSKVELEITLQRIEKEKQNWQMKFDKGQAQLEDLHHSLSNAQSEAERVKMELLQLSNAHHSLEQQNQSLRQSISSLQHTPSTMQTSNDTDLTGDEVDMKIQEAKNAAVAAVQAEHDEALNDLLVCLGQSERAVQILSEKLKEFGLDSDQLIDAATIEEDE